MLTEGVTRVLGTRPIAALWRRVRPGLRIVAYHDVPDAQAFEAHLDRVLHAYTPVSGAQVTASVRHGRVLPPDAVWLTFDDGDPTVVAHAQGALLERAVPATLFVCPGLVAEGRVPWWTTVRAAGEAGHGAELAGTVLRGAPLARALKQVPDARRREVVEHLRPFAPPPAAASLLDVDALRTWQGAGLEVGNHTWDHPCLDRCEPAEQTRQIVTAHDWLVANLDPPDLLFAYPNGDRTDHAHGELRRLGYETPLLFDHRLNGGRRPVPGGGELSRLRLDSWAPLPRARAVISAAHADVFALRR